MERLLNPHIDAVPPGLAEKVAPLSTSSFSSSGGDDGAFREQVKKYAAHAASSAVREVDPAVVVAASMPVTAPIELKTDATQFPINSTKTLARLVWQASARGASSITLKLDQSDLGELQLTFRLVGRQLHMQADAKHQKVLGYLAASHQDLSDALRRWGITLSSLTIGDKQLVTDTQTAGASYELRRNYMEVIG